LIFAVISFKINRLKQRLKKGVLESQGNFGVLEAACLSKDAQICSLKVDKKRLEVSFFLSFISVDNQQ
jgi:hypothetical protein